MFENGHFLTLAPDNEMPAEPRKPPMPNTVAEPNQLPPVSLCNSERDEIRRCVLNFKAHQERFARERENFAASQLARLLGVRDTLCYWLGANPR